jgi:hypothetical protein
VILSSLFLLSASSEQISPSILYSQEPSTYSLPLMLQIKFLIRSTYG